MSDPVGLIDGQAPLLTAFLIRRRVAIARVHQLHALLSLSAPPSRFLVEFNALCDVLSGRRLA